jgi:CRISPR type I-F-associated protein Csy2
MSYSYLIIPRIQVQNANAQPVAWIIGPPPVTAYAGFAHALALAAGATGHCGVGIVHHDIQFLGEEAYFTLNPHQFRAAGLIDPEDYAKGGNNLSAQPSARCHLTVSLAIRFKADEALSITLVEPFLRGARLAGGSIVEHGFHPENSACFFDDEADVDVIINAIGSGHAIHERQDLMQKQDHHTDILDTLLQAANQAKTPEADAHWLMPTALGYVQITPATKRNKSRGDIDHAFAEVLVGMVQYRLLRTEGLPFWRYTHPKPGVFVCATTDFSDTNI